jgi:hypothetical protein
VDVVGLIHPQLYPAGVALEGGLMGVYKRAWGTAATPSCFKQAREYCVPYNTCYYNLGLGQFCLIVKSSSL